MQKDERSGLLSSQAAPLAYWEALAVLLLAIPYKYIVSVSVATAVFPSELEGMVAKSSVVAMSGLLAGSSALLGLTAPFAGMVIDRQGRGNYHGFAIGVGVFATAGAILVSIAVRAHSFGMYFGGYMLIALAIEGFGAPLLLGLLAVYSRHTPTRAGAFSAMYAGGFALGTALCSALAAAFPVGPSAATPSAFYDISAGLMLACVAHAFIVPRRLLDVREMQLRELPSKASTSAAASDGSAGAENGDDNESCCSCGLGRLCGPGYGLYRRVAFASFLFCFALGGAQSAFYFEDCTDASTLNRSQAQATFSKWSIVGCAVAFGISMVAAPLIDRFGAARVAPAAIALASAVMLYAPWVRASWAYGAFVMPFLGSSMILFYVAVLPLLSDVLPSTSFASSDAGAWSACNMLGIAFGLGSWGVVLTMLNPAGATKASSPHAAAALNLATAATADVRKPYACSSYVTVNYSAAAVMLVATVVLWMACKEVLAKPKEAKTDKAGEVDQYEKQ